MKTLRTLLSIVATILTVGCGRPNSLILLAGEEQPGSAGARPDTVSLEELAEATAQQGAQFFEERGNLTKLQELGLYNNPLPCLRYSLRPWLQQSKLTATGNPWWQPDGLQEIKYEELKQIAEKQLKIFQQTITSMAKAAMETEKFRVDLETVGDKVKVKLENRDFHQLIAYTLLPHLLDKGRLNRDTGIVCFERGIPFYLDHQLCTTTDVDKLLEDLENKRLYRFRSEAQFKEPDLVFNFKFPPQAGVADEVMADMIRYSAHHHPEQVKTLAILGKTLAILRSTETTTLLP